MNQYVLAALAALTIIALFRRRHYLASLFIAMVAMYELTAPILYQLDIFDDIVSALALYASVATEERIREHVLSVGLYLAFLLIGYLGALWLLRSLGIPQPASRSPVSFNGPGSARPGFYFLLLIILVFGIISWAMDAGRVRLLDYLGYDLYGTPFYSYGTLLFVCLAPLAIVAVQRRAWAYLLIVVLCAFPIATEIFISSRRQFFAPTVLYGIFYFLYSDRSPIRHVRLITFIALSLVFFGLQANMRTTITGTALIDQEEALPLAVQLGEFVAIGSTTLFSVSLINEANFTGFLQFIITGVANSIPYYKLGDIAFPEYVEYIRSMVEQIAPFGGLSGVAEAYMSAGNFGVGIVGMLTGVLLMFGERSLRVHMTKPLVPTFGSLYMACVVTTLFMKYRSGFTDAFLTFVAFTFLYAFALLPSFIASWRLRLSAQAGASPGNETGHLRAPGRARPISPDL